MPSVVITLTGRQARLLLALLEHAANEHAEAITDQGWDWLDDLFGATWEDLEGARDALTPEPDNGWTEERWNEG